jgi:hypothetical protein
LITEDTLKVEAIRAALPRSRYELKTAATYAEVNALINSRTKYLPDVILLDGLLGSMTKHRPKEASQSNKLPKGSERRSFSRRQVKGCAIKHAGCTIEQCRGARS